MIMLVYFAEENVANGPAAYSTLKLDTSSDFPIKLNEALLGLHCSFNCTLPDPVLSRFLSQVLITREYMALQTLSLLLLLGNIL